MSISIVYGYLAAHSRRLERVLITLNDRPDLERHDELRRGIIWLGFNQVPV